MDNNASKTVRTYEASGEILTPLASLQLAYRELFWSRHVIWHLFVRDFVAGFRQKLLGYFWVVLTPLIGIASFVFMQSTGILNPGNMGIPYPVYVYIGTTIWGLLMSSMAVVSVGLINNADLVMRTNIPTISLAVTGLANIFYNLLVNLVVLLFLLLFFKLIPSPWVILYPLAVLPIIVLGMGIGLFLAVVGSVARDVTGIFTTVFTLAMYITPVVYTAEFEHPFLRSVVQWNPLTYLINTPREIIVSGDISAPFGYSLATMVAFILLFLGVHAFYLIKDKVAERL